VHEATVGEELQPTLRVRAMLAIILVHPEIPPNTGNIIRLAANTGAALHLVEPLGFRLEDRELKRAGLDYHEYARVRVHRDWPSCRAALEAETARRWYALTTRAERSLFDCAFRADDVFVFGCETAGLPAAILEEFAPETRLRIPMRDGVRSLNLSNAVAVAVYEAWRQAGFTGAAIATESSTAKR
jgi:tRNA (cytidine/uridine-2'-O-)-methyltransferase